MLPSQIQTVQLREASQGSQHNSPQRTALTAYYLVGELLWQPRPCLYRFRLRSRLSFRAELPSAPCGSNAELTPTCPRTRANLPERVRPRRQSVTGWRSIWGETQIAAQFGARPQS